MRRQEEAGEHYQILTNTPDELLHQLFSWPLFTKKTLHTSAAVLLIKLLAKFAKLTVGDKLAARSLRESRKEPHRVYKNLPESKNQD